MRSGDASDLLDLSRIVTTPEDVRALRQARERAPLPSEDFLKALAALPQPSHEALRRRRGPSGPDPFRL